MKNISSDFSLTAGELQFLADSVCSGKSPAASVFRIAGQAAQPDDTCRRLQEKHYVGADGKPVQALLRLLDILVTSDACAWLGYEGSQLILGAAIYHSGDQRVLMHETPGGVRLVSPVPERIALELLGHHLGVSPLRTLSMDKVAGMTDALVLGAIIDLRRRELMGALLDRGPEAAGLVPLSRIVDWIDVREPGSQWLTSHLRAFLAIEEPPAAVEIRAALDRLGAEGYVTESNSGMFRSTDKIDEVARQLLLISNRVLLKATSLTPDKQSSVQTEIEVLQSGVNGLLLLDHTGPAHVRLVGMSSQWVLALVSHLFENPRHLGGLAAKTYVVQPATGAGEAGLSCPSCGGENPVGSKFCCHCGRALEKHCGRCGAGADADHRFCCECGYPLSGIVAGEKT